MKKILIFVSFSILLPLAWAFEICDKKPLVPVYINGIYTTQNEAERQRTRLSDNSDAIFKLVYNRTNGKITDLWEVLKLKLAEQKTEVKNNFNLEKFIEKLNEDPAKSITKIAAGSQEWSDQLLGDMYVEAHKVAQKNNDLRYEDEPLTFMTKQFKSLVAPKQRTLLVAHSQGNLYVPWLKDRLEKDGYDNSLITHIGLANPANNSYAMYFNHKNDAVLNLLRTFFNVLPQNFENESKEFGNHGLVETYLLGMPVDFIRRLVKEAPDTLNYDIRHEKAIGFEIKNELLTGNKALVSLNGQDLPYSVMGDGLFGVGDGFTIFCMGAKPGDYTLSIPTGYYAGGFMGPNFPYAWQLETKNETLSKGEGAFFPLNTAVVGRKNIVSWRIKDFEFHKTIEILPNE